MRKTLCILLAIVMFTFVACDTNSKQNENTPTKSEENSSIQDHYLSSNSKNYQSNTIVFAQSSNLKVQEHSKVSELKTAIAEINIENILISYDDYQLLGEDELVEINTIILNASNEGKRIVLYGDFEYEQIKKSIKPIDSNLFTQMSKIDSSDNKKLKAFVFYYNNDSISFARIFSDLTNISDQNNINMFAKLDYFDNNTYDFNNFKDEYTENNFFGKALDIFDYKDFYMTTHYDLFQFDNAQSKKWGVYSEISIESHTEKINYAQITHSAYKDSSNVILSDFIPNPAGIENEYKTEKISNNIPYEILHAYKKNTVFTGQIDDNPNSIIWKFDFESNNESKEVFNSASIWGNKEMEFQNNLIVECSVNDKIYKFVNYLSSE